MPPSSQLGSRLHAIFEIVKEAQKNQNYSSIWDCCCDHGYLGIKMLREDLCKKIIFVDKLPHIIESLSLKLAPFNTGKHELKAADASDLEFDLQCKHLVIVAGVGGETSPEIVESIEKNHSHVHIDYLFCPSARQKELREYLADQQFGLLSEHLVGEKKRYYEILLVRQPARACELAAVPLSCNLWDDENVDQQRFLKKMNTPRQSKKPKRKRIESHNK